MVADDDRHGHVLAGVLVLLVDVGAVVAFDEPDTELVGVLNLVAIESDVDVPESGSRHTRNAPVR